MNVSDESRKGLHNRRSRVHTALMEQQGAYWDLEQCRWVRFVSPDLAIDLPEQRTVEQQTAVEESPEVDVRSG